MAEGTIAGRIVGTVEGRNIEVARPNPHHIIVRDAAAAHTNAGFVLNVNQARELADALLAAVNR